MMSVDRMPLIRTKGEKGRCEERSGPRQEGRHCTQRNQGWDQHLEMPGLSLVGIFHYQ